MSGMNDMHALASHLLILELAISYTWQILRLDLPAQDGRCSAPFALRPPHQEPRLLPLPSPSPHAMAAVDARLAPLRIDLG